MKFRYSLKPLWVKNNSSVVCTPADNYTLSKGGAISFPVFVKIHFVKDKFFPQNKCSKTKKNPYCVWCNSQDKNVARPKTYISFPAKVDNDVRIIFVPLNYLPSNFFENKKFKINEFKNLQNNVIKIEVKDKKMSYTIVTQNDKVDLTDSEKYVIRNKLLFTNKKDNK